MIRDLLAEHAREPAHWRPFAHFLPTGYARNLVHKTDAYELLVLCWEDGAESPIHDHMGQDCWMAVLEGSIEEVQFQEPAGEGPLDQRAVRTFARGEVAYIHDDIALHLVRPVGGAGISLHLYARPYDSCHVFCPDTGRIADKPLVYHSIAGLPIEPPRPT